VVRVDGKRKMTVEKVEDGKGNLGIGVEEGEVKDGKGTWWWFEGGAGYAAGVEAVCAAVGERL
jgi:hypothetical protein